MGVEQRETLGEYLDAVFDALVIAISDGRKIPKAEVPALIDLDTVTATEALAKKMVDAILYPDELDKHLEKIYQGSVSFLQGHDTYAPERSKWNSSEKIAVVHVDATIAGGESQDLPFGLGTTVGGARWRRRWRRSGTTIRSSPWSCA